MFKNIFNQKNKAFQNKKLKSFILFSGLILFCLNAKAENLDQYLMIKSNYQNKKLKYDAVLINKIKQNGQNKAILNTKSVNIEKLLYEKSEKIMASDSIFIEDLLNKTKISRFIGNSSFIYPLIGAITSGFGTREHPVFKIQSFHSGVDIAAPENSAIIASNNGKIIYTGQRSGYGNMIIISHGSSNGHLISSVYGHLSKILVLNNQFVKKGQLIALEGSTGTSTGPHLHFELRESGKPVNPLVFVK